MKDYGVQMTKEEEAKVDELCEKIRARVAKEAMTPRKRFEALWKGEQIDRIPVQVNAIGLHSAAFSGKMPPDLYSDAKVSLMAYLSHLEHFGYDMVSQFRFSGGEKEWGGVIEMVAFSSLKKGSVESGPDLDKVKFPDVYKDGTLPWQLWMIAVLKEKLGDIMPVFGFMGMPGSLVPVLAPMDKLYIWVKTNRPLMHAIAALHARYCTEYALAMVEAGADAVRMVGCDDVVSLNNHMEYQFPYICGVTRMVSKPMYIIGAGDWSHTLESHALAGVQGFEVVNGTPIENARDVAMKYNRVVQYGFDSHIIVHGPVEKIREEVKEFIKKAYVPGFKFVLTTEAVDFATPNENLEAFVAAVKEFGRLPLKINEE